MSFSFKYGKGAPESHPRTLYMSHYIPAGELPAPPDTVFWENNISDAQWAETMFGNDQFGDCFWAGQAHDIMLRSSYTGKVIVPELVQVLGAYSQCTGFNPDNPQSDQGTVATRGLEFMRTVGLADHQIKAWLAVDFTNAQHRDLAIYLFGSLGMGVQMPTYTQQQFDEGKPWQVIPGHCKIEGEHWIPYYGQDATSNVCLTWAKKQVVEDDFTSQFGDESYATIDDLWIDNATKLSPSHFDVEHLLADLRLLGD